MRWLLLVVLLSACAPLQVKPPAGPVEFDLSGRIAARYRDDAFSGIVSWRHAGEGDDMLISTPMGQGVARIVRQGDAIVLTTSEGKEYSDRDGEALTERALGFRLPLAGLADWVRGQAAESPRPIQTFDEGRLKMLEQGGWRIEYQSYQGERPARMRLIYPGIELRLAITEWK